MPPKSDTDLTLLPAHVLHEKILRGETTSSEITARIFENIERRDRKLKAYLLLMRDEAFRTAEEVDRNVKAGGRIPPLAGIPLALKDNLCVTGTETTCSSKILKGFIAPYDATVVERLRAAGSVFVGKTNLDEFAMGSSTENSAFGPTHNPWDISRAPGGSSGGSAAAVTAGEAILALGSDTGGSIRQPAAFCGIVGLKPTYGRVSRYGLVAFASSLDQIGPLTRDVTDCALLMNVIGGHDPRDSTSAEVECPDFTQSLRTDVKGLRIGVPREYFQEGIDPEVVESIKTAVRVLEDLGAERVDISLPHYGYALAVYYIVAPAEASSNLARYDGVKYGFRYPERDNLIEMYAKTKSAGFGPEVKRRIMLGTFALSSGYYDAYYLKAQKVRTLIKNDFEKAFEHCDLVVTPTAPTPAFKLGEKVDDPLQMYLSDVFTLSVNLTGLPGMVVPCGLSSNRLPIGLQIIGRAFDEETLFRTAYTFEQNTDHHKQVPDFSKIETA
ncbi:MAG: Asp-tRNA(Asn)/Glu-tRNA(Gln) amidotransferase subunit GatA [Candidatus Abyssobacteria bacterium SURF_17]|uniref:Glutamyl-tRNA(Gln) amidotransferase subunit A n=1 Tax=Candidatus Abyssobacteria bacterium SURF_17 TaxID=2093361 RepID=A0A419EWM4_9BACT|nr:MAG: Asp-tRNA(Asn)/Glu-tRNA(Gln) amidotransferase subunit GatA [Candidatus Abyssubacteria bacterium SURF_17]